MIEELFPREVKVTEAFLDPADGWLFPQEQKIIARAVAKRRQEFTTGRHCARSALARLGVPPTPILQGPRGAPRWPPGIVGSITHCPGYRACAVARSEDLSTLGLDAEPNQQLPAGVLRQVAARGELAHVADLGERRPGICWDRLLFSAKEAVYKAWFPLTQEWLGFQDAEIAFHVTGTFTASLGLTRRTPAGERPAGFEGRWLARSGLLLTAVAVSSRRPAPPG